MTGRAALLRVLFDEFARVAEVELLLGFALFMSGADEAPLRPVDLSAVARPCVYKYEYIYVQRYVLRTVYNSITIAYTLLYYTYIPYSVIP